MEYTDKNLGKNYDVIYEKFHVKVDTDISKTSDRYSSTISRAKNEKIGKSEREITVETENRTELHEI